MVEAKRQVGNLFLVLIGRGTLESEIRRQVDDLGLRESCRLITDCANPLPFLCASRVAILTSLLEGCSNALLEAMAMGLPVVASNTGGTPELVTHGRGGYLCPVGEVGSFAKALVRLASEPHTANRMGRYNRQRVDERFTDEVLVTRSLSLYESILDQTFEKRSALTVTDGRTVTSERATGYPR
jgi:glycosyltransferase involved in cell wall biosynthesis